MVKKLSAQDRAAINQAIKEAEQTTSAELAVVIARVSDPYQSIALCCGLAAGSMIALILWYFKGVSLFPFLLAIQLLAALLFMALPWLRHACLAIVPKRLMHYRAGQRAAIEYMHLASHLPERAPVVMIYISLAEHYAHIHASRGVMAHIPATEWNVIVRTLTRYVRDEGFRAGVIKCVKRTGELLSLKFPPGMRHTEIPNVIEI